MNKAKRPRAGKSQHPKVRKAEVRKKVRTETPSEKQQVEAASDKGKHRVKPGTSKAAAAQRKVLFIEAYVSNGGNGTQAAITAGFNRRSAYARASELVRDREVSAEIERRRAEAREAAGLNTEKVWRNVAQTILFDPRKLFKDGALLPVHELDDDTAAALSGFDSNLMPKWGDKGQAREQAMKHLGMFEEDNAQQNPLDGISNDEIRVMMAALNALPPAPIAKAGTVPEPKL